MSGEQTVEVSGGEAGREFVSAPGVSGGCISRQSENRINKLSSKAISPSTV